MFCGTATAMTMTLKVAIVGGHAWVCVPQAKFRGGGTRPRPPYYRRPCKQDNVQTESVQCTYSEVRINEISEQLSKIDQIG